MATPASDAAKSWLDRQFPEGEGPARQSVLHNPDVDQVRALMGLRPWSELTPDEREAERRQFYADKPA